MKLCLFGFFILASCSLAEHRSSSCDLLQRETDLFFRAILQSEGKATNETLIRGTAIVNDGQC